MGHVSRLWAGLAVRRCLWGAGMFSDHCAASKFAILGGSCGIWVGLGGSAFRRAWDALALCLWSLARASRRPQEGPNMATRDPKMASKRPQDGSKEAPRWPKMAPRGPKMAPRGSKIAPNGLKMAQLKLGSNFGSILAPCLDPFWVQKASKTETQF